MKITKYGHACLLIEEGEGRFLIDPGAYSSGFEGVEGLSAILITHEHPDHLVIDNIMDLLRMNPKAIVVADSASAGQLKSAAIETHTLNDGQSIEVAGVNVMGVGEWHAEIHQTIPLAVNIGYRIGDGFYYPGDALQVPSFKVEVLAIPSAAPWSKVSETIDYLLELKPKVAIPVHDGILSRPSLYAQMLERFSSGVGTQLLVLEAGVPVEL